MNARVPDSKPLEWPGDTQNLYSSDPLPHLDVRCVNPSTNDCTSDPLYLRIPCGEENDNGNTNLNFIVSHTRGINYTSIIISKVRSVDNGYVHVGATAYDTYRADRPYDSQDIGLPPRKRIQHAMIPGFDVLNGAPLQSQNMSLQS